MISLGAGFNPELTGYENIVLYGTLLGRDPDEMAGRIGQVQAHTNDVRVRFCGQSE